LNSTFPISIHASSSRYIFEKKIRSTPVCLCLMKALAIASASIEHILRSSVSLNASYVKYLCIEHEPWLFWRCMLDFSCYFGGVLVAGLSTANFGVESMFHAVFSAVLSPPSLREFSASFIHR